MMRIGNNKWVAAGLRPRPWLEVTVSYPTDEGFYSCERYYQLERCRLVRHTNTRARDCDGRMDTHDTCVCTGLRVYRWAGRPRLALQWERLHSSQRDYTAESMGY